MCGSCRGCVVVYIFTSVQQRDSRSETCTAWRLTIVENGLQCQQHWPVIRIGLLCERHNKTTSHIAVVLSLVSTVCLYLFHKVHIWLKVCLTTCNTCVFLGSKAKVAK